MRVQNKNVNNIDSSNRVIYDLNVSIKHCLHRLLMLKSTVNATVILQALVIVTTMNSPLQ